MQNYRDSEAYFERWSWFLKLESDAERERLASRRATRKARGMSDRSMEAQGDTLMHMVIADDRTGLGGRTIVNFVKRERNQILPWNRFRVGSPVVASDEQTLMDVPPRASKWSSMPGPKATSFDSNSRQMRSRANVSRPPCSMRSTDEDASRSSEVF